MNTPYTKAVSKTRTGTRHKHSTIGHMQRQYQPYQSDSKHRTGSSSRSRSMYIHAADCNKWPECSGETQYINDHMICTCVLNVRRVFDI